MPGKPTLEQRVKTLETENTHRSREIAALTTKVVALEQTISNLRTALTQVSTPAANGWLGFDIQDDAHRADSRQLKSAPPGAYISEVQTYIEDGHIKMAFGYHKLPVIKF